MSELYEIYEKYSKEYDNFVSYEDYKNNLKQFLLTSIDWKNKTVYEAGIGTGRVTKIYIPLIEKVYGFDRSMQMLENTKHNLEEYKAKIDIRIGENLILPEVEQKVDIFIEGWSFGHTVCDDPKGIEKTVDILINSCIDKIKKDGKIILIESLGTNRDKAEGPKPELKMFYFLLEDKYKFRKNIIETDYMFPDVESAKDKIGFFFGKQMKQDIEKKGVNIVKEFTGVWIK